MIKIHDGGMVEIETDHTTLVFTDEEYRRALRRGLSVKVNRITADRVRLATRSEKGGFQHRLSADN